ncbi:MAG: type II secretion system GspH family protein [Firmicutes bacterium]|jgi:prepilin-type N-terminal cleavage/methylation domain-containing protein|nr:type II secretion system GspH family protein [Bacillota bacterium]MCL5065719.1 type II secretion system GspH family protein [Bacillota bacterium]
MTKLRDRGDTLIEVMAAVVLIGFIVLGVTQWSTSTTHWVDQDQEQAQALVYARQGIELVRSKALADYTSGEALAAVAPPTLPMVRGVAYTETISGPVTPPWDNDAATVTVQEYTVTVSWPVAGTSGPDRVSLTAVIDPAVVNS